MTQNLMQLKMKLSNEEFTGQLLARGPVFWSEPDQFWVVTDHSLATSVLRSDQFSADRSGFFMSRMSKCPFHKVANFFGVVKKMMVTSDPPHHTARRKLAAFGIADHVIDEFAPNVERLVGELVRACRLKAEYDFVEDLALPLPNIVLADLFSIPADKRPDFYRWANHMTQFFGGASDNIEVDAENADSGAFHLRRYFAELIAERRKTPANDFLSHLLKYQAELGLDDDEVISQAAIMLVAGTVTTTDQMANIMNVFLENPSVMNDLQNEPALLDRATEEATRLDPAVSFVFRVAKSDVLLGEVEVKAGQLVFISVGAANRNEVIFTEPHRFQMERVKNPHLSYGSGIHYCLGARLGRIQIQALFRELFKEHRDFKLVDEPTRKDQSLAFSGFETMRLKRSEKESVA